MKYDSIDEFLNCLNLSPSDIKILSEINDEIEYFINKGISIDLVSKFVRNISVKRITNSDKYISDIIKIHKKKKFNSEVKSIEYIMDEFLEN